MTNLTSKRDYSIDILRAIAIVGIIIAHSTPNDLIFQIRNFDVVLMVLLMGASYYLSNQNKKINYIDYLIKRFNRLVVPTWQFLAIFFVLFYGLSVYAGSDYYFNFETIKSSFLLLDGIGYVWIMRVFFLVAMLSPLMLFISKKIKNNLIYLGFIVVLYGVYTVLIQYNSTMSGNLGYYTEQIVVYGLGYIIVFAVGLRLKQFSTKDINILLGFMVGMLIVLMYINDFRPVQEFKYPPKLYYMSYGITVSLFLYQLLKINVIKNILQNKFVLYLSHHSIWLYFWHIIFVYALKLYSSHFKMINESFITRFLFIFLLALLTTFIHNVLKGYWKQLKSKKSNDVSKETSKQASM